MFLQSVEKSMTPTMITNLLQIFKIELDREKTGKKPENFNYENWFTRCLKNGDLGKFRLAIEKHPEIIQELTLKSQLTEEDKIRAIQSLGF